MLKTAPKELLIIVLLYTIAFGCILFNKGIYWDDWTLFNMDPNIVVETFHQNGHPWIGYFHNFILSFRNGLTLYRIIIFLNYLASVLILYDILKKIKEIAPSERFFLVLFFAIFPVNFGRITLICAPYSIYYCVFYMAFWLSSKYLINKKVHFRILSLFLFLISFFTCSFLVFYSIVLMFLAYHEREHFRGFLSFFTTILKYLDFIILPIVFWIIRGIFFHPLGNYINYNKLDLSRLPWAFVKTFHVFYTSLFEVIKVSLGLNSFLFLLLGGVVLFLIFKRLNQAQEMMDKHDKWFLCLGVYAFYAGAFAYVAIGSPVTMYDWVSKDQLLLSFGAAFILFYSIKILLKNLEVNSEIRLLIFSILIFSFINLDMQSYLGYMKDWYKQIALMEHYKSSEIIKNNTTFLFVDQTLDLNEKNRYYRFYDYTGPMKYIFGNEIRYGINIDRYIKGGLELGTPFFNKLFCVKDYIKKNPEYNIIIKHGDFSINKTPINENFIRLVYYDFFKPEKLKSTARPIVSLEYISLKEAK